MGHRHVFDGAVDGRWARVLVGREIWYGARGLKKVSFLMEAAGRAVAQARASKRSIEHAIRLASEQPLAQSGARKHEQVIPR